MDSWSRRLPGCVGLAKAAEACDGLRWNLLRRLLSLVWEAVLSSVQGSELELDQFVLQSNILLRS